MTEGGSIFWLQCCGLRLDESKSLKTFFESRAAPQNRLDFKWLLEVIKCKARVLA